MSEPSRGRSPSPFPGRVALQQRVLPAYRAPFLEAFAKDCKGGLLVFAGPALAVEGISTIRKLRNARLTHTRNRQLFHPLHPLFVCWQPDILTWLKAARPDVLIVEANPRYPSSRKAIQWMHRQGKPVLGWGLGAPPLRGPFKGWRSHARRDFLRSLDGVIAYSHKGAAEYRAPGVLPPEKVFIAPNAAAPRPESPPPERPPGASSQPTVLFVGRLQARKHVDLLLQACAELPVGLQPQLIIVGDGPARAALHKLAIRIFPGAEFPGAIHGASLEPYFTRADLFVLPGTGGLAIQLAMAHALPVIVGRGDGTQAELVRPENGWVIPSEDLSALVQTLQLALSDIARLRRMGRESFRIVRDEINLERMVQAFVTALHRVTVSGNP